MYASLSCSESAHWSLNYMDAIWQTPLSNTFSSKHYFAIWGDIDLGQHWLRQWLDDSLNPCNTDVFWPHSICISFAMLYDLLCEFLNFSWIIITHLIYSSCVNGSNSVNCSVFIYTQRECVWLLLTRNVMLVNIVAAEELVLKHQVISSHNTELTSAERDWFHKMVTIMRTHLRLKLIWRKKTMTWSSKGHGWFDQLVWSHSVLTSGACPTNDISIKLKIRPKFEVL